MYNEEAFLLGIHALKVGKFFVSLVPVAGALLLAYEVRSYLADHPELTAGKFLEATEFAKDIVDKAKDVIKTKPHETGAQSASGGPDDDGDDDKNHYIKKAEFHTKEETRSYSSGETAESVNKFFKGATGKSKDFKILEKADGSQRIEFFSPANNPGYGKKYVQIIDKNGEIIKEFKDTIGPNGFI